MGRSDRNRWWLSKSCLLFGHVSLTMRSFHCHFKCQSNINFLTMRLTTHFRSCFYMMNVSSKLFSRVIIMYLGEFFFCYGSFTKLDEWTFYAFLMTNFLILLPVQQFISSNQNMNKDVKGFKLVKECCSEDVHQTYADFTFKLFQEGE